MRGSPKPDIQLCTPLLGTTPSDVTAPPPPDPSLNKPSVLSSPPPLRGRNPCSCLGWDRAHTVVLARAVVGVAVVIAIVTVIARLVLVIVVRKLRSGADVVDGRGSIGRVGWRKVRVRVQRTRSMCRRCLRKPLRSRWIPVSLWSVAEEVWTGRDAQQVWSCIKSWSRGGVRVANSVCFNARTSWESGNSSF